MWSYFRFSKNWPFWQYHFTLVVCIVSPAKWMCVSSNAAHSWLKIALAEVLPLSHCLVSLFVNLCPIPLEINETHTKSRAREKNCPCKKQNKRLKRHLGGKLRNQKTQQEGLPRLRSQTVCFASYVDAASPLLPVWFCLAIILHQAASHKLYVSSLLHAQKTNTTHLPRKKKIKKLNM